MRQTIRWMWIGLLVVLVFLTACGSTAEESGDGKQAGVMPDDVPCEVFYRPAAGAPFEESMLTLSTDGSQGSLSCEDMGVVATVLSDAGEGISLAIVVTDLASGAE